MSKQTSPHRGAFINPDSRGVLVLAILMVVTIGAVSFVLSYTGLVAVALWAAVPPDLVWTVPVIVDGAILLYTVAALVFRSRGDSSWVAWTSLTMFTALSVTANAAHAWVEAPFHDGRAVLGTVIAGLAPIALLLTTHTLASLVVARPETLAALEETAEAVPEPVRRPVAVPAAPQTLVQIPDQPAEPAKAAMTAEDRDEKIHTLRHVEGLSMQAIANQLAISKTTVVRVLSRAEDTEPVTA